jgi:hypothetical protein
MVCRKWNEKEKGEKKKRIIRGRDLLFRGKSKSGGYTQQDKIKHVLSDQNQKKRRLKI